MGSACDSDSERAIRRAYFELLERTSILEAECADPTRDWSLRDSTGAIMARGSAAEVFPQSPSPEAWQYARSNGVAAHLDWERACRGAALEILERDRLLRSWLGESAPFRLHPRPRTELVEQLPEFDFELYRFEPRRDSEDEVHVLGLFAFHRGGERPPVFGFGTGLDRQEALAHAEDELCQRAGFLWSEEIPDSLPEFAPTPGYHLGFYLAPGADTRLRAWLDGGRTRKRAPTPARSDRIRFVDLTPSRLREQLVIVKAVSSEALPLCFGAWPECAAEPHPIA
jgi:hypothetical protein